MSAPARVALVTGAAGGIGLATARRLLEDGASVMLADLRQDRLDAAGAALGASERVATVVCDVASEQQVEAAVEATLARFGRWDILVNNAGLMEFKPLVELGAADWRRVLDVDLVGAFSFVRQALLKMQEGGAVVNVSSVHAEATEALVAPYAAAKAALLSLTRSASIEGEARRIRVNAILPGAVDTPMLWDNPNVRSGVEVIRASDVGTPEQIAAAIAFLASDDAAFIRGAALRVDGGRLAHL